MDTNKMINKFKDTLRDGKCVIGPFMKTGDPAFVESAGHAGFDFVILDTEHGPVSLETMQNNVRAAVVSNVLPVIRVENMSETAIGKALDIGAMGVQVPQVKSAAEAREIIRAAKFHPKGERGVCRFVRAADYSAMDRHEYFKKANDCLLILQLEGQEALDNIDEILEIEDIDILFIGPYDLSQSLGMPGDIGNKKVVEKMQYIVDKCKKKNIIAGTFLDKTEDIEKWKNAGVQYLSYSVDVGIFYEACRKITKELHS